MKKNVWTALICAGLILAVIGCGKKEEGTEVQNGETQGTESTEAAAPVYESELVTLGTYKGVEAEAPVLTATEEEIQKEIDYLMSQTYLEEIEGKTVVEEGDIVNIDYKGLLDGEEFDGGTSQGYNLTIGSGQFIDGFEDQLIGKELGGSYSLDLKFPENYAEDLAGKPVVFEVTVNKIQQEVEAELTDEFVSKHMDHETVDALKGAIRTDVEAYKKSNEANMWQENVLRAVIANCEFANTEAEIADAASAQSYQYEYYASMYGMDMETFLKTALGMTKEEFDAECQSYAELTVKTNLLLSAVAEAEGFSVSDEEYETAVVEQYGYESVEVFEETYTKEDLVNSLLQQKAVDLLVENAVQK